jgi:predicted O-methyltransferase YrrM
VGGGTGQSFLVLASSFEDVVALDPDEHAVGEAQRLAAEAGLTG